MNARHLILILAITAAMPFSGWSQIGGSYTYQFLTLPNAARNAALGGEMVAVTDDDLNLAFHNPALLNSSMDQHLSFNYVGYFAETKYGYASYARNYDTLGTFALGMHYINYGEFIRAEETAEITGSFRAAEYALNIMYSRQLDSNWTVGATFKPIYSSLENYQSLGFAFDIGASYVSYNGLFTGALVIKNAGFQAIKYYKDAGYEPLPFEIQAGISQKLEYAPFRLFATVHSLQRYDLTYQKPEDPNNNPFFTQTPTKKNPLEEHADKIARHLIFGTEFTPLDNFYIRLGYNYQRRQELKIDDRTAMVGFSWGFGLKIKRFHIHYGRASYHLAGASNHFSVSTNLSEFYHRAR
ncbi:MAG: type IX secretion system protein PorQ [Bacteroidota bacterium]